MAARTESHVVRTAFAESEEASRQGRVTTVKDEAGGGDLQHRGEGGTSGRARRDRDLYLVDENLVTAFVPSEIACFNTSQSNIWSVYCSEGSECEEKSSRSPGRMRRTEVWTSRDEMVDFLFSSEPSGASQNYIGGLSKRQRPTRLRGHAGQFRSETTSAMLISSCFGSHDAACFH